MNDLLYYKNLPHTSTKRERKQFTEHAIEWLENNKWFNGDGEVKYNFPSVFRDSGNMRKEKAEEKLSNCNSYVYRLFALLGEDRFFYTIILSDVKKKWSKYETVFDPKEMKAVKSFVARNIKGPYSATIELCGYSGPHIHIISRKQENIYLKAEKWIYKEEGLIEYLSKSKFSIKEKYKDKNTDYLIGEEYLVMLGCWIYWKRMMGKRFSNTSWARLKSSQNRYTKKKGKRLCESGKSSDGLESVYNIVIDPLFPAQD